MNIVTSFGQRADASVFVDLSLLDPVEAARHVQQEGGDMVAFSTEAIEALSEAGQKALVHHALSLPQITSRIETVRAEIESVWNSSMPKKEKLSLISSKENEIALLQAGQFVFARAGFSMVA